METVSFFDLKLIIFLKTVVIFAKCLPLVP